MDPTLRFLLDELVKAWDSGDPNNKLATLFPLVKTRLEQADSQITTQAHPVGPTQAPQLPLRRHSHKVKKPIPFEKNPHFHAPADALADEGKVNETGIAFE